MFRTLKIECKKNKNTLLSLLLSILVIGMATFINSPGQVYGFDLGDMTDVDIPDDVDIDLDEIADGGEGMTVEESSGISEGDPDSFDATASIIARAVAQALAAAAPLIEEEIAQIEVEMCAAQLASYTGEAGSFVCVPMSEAEKQAIRDARNAEIEEKITALVLADLPGKIGPEAGTVMGDEIANDDGTGELPDSPDGISVPIPSFTYGICHSSNETVFGGALLMSILCDCDENGTGFSLEGVVGLVKDISVGAGNSSILFGLRIDNDTNACLFMWRYPLMGCILGDYEPNTQGDNCYFWIPVYNICIPIIHIHHATKIGTSIPIPCSDAM